MVKKGGNFDKSIHKAMIFPVGINQTNKKLSVMVQPKNACKLEFADHLWLPVLDQSQSDIVFFSILIFIYITL